MRGARSLLPLVPLQQHRANRLQITGLHSFRSDAYAAFQFAETAFNPKPAQNIHVGITSWPCLSLDLGGILENFVPRRSLKRGGTVPPTLRVCRSGSGLPAAPRCGLSHFHAARSTRQCAHAQPTRELTASRSLPPTCTLLVEIGNVRERHFRQHTFRAGQHAASDVHVQGEAQMFRQLWSAKTACDENFGPRNIVCVSIRLVVGVQSGRAATAASKSPGWIKKAGCSAQFD